jgi:hypothetical protein
MSPAVITWSTPVDRHLLPLTTTVSFRTVELTGHKDRCGGTAREFSLVGSVLSNSRAPGVKVNGKVKMFICDAGGVLSQRKAAKL